MPLWTSAAVAAPRLPEIFPKAISPSRKCVIALVTIIAVSTLVAAIGVLAACVVVVQTVEITDSLAWQTVLNMAVAGALVQISLLSFMFVWESIDTAKRPAQLAEPLHIGHLVFSDVPEPDGDRVPTGEPKAHHPRLMIQAK